MEKHSNKGNNLKDIANMLGLSVSTVSRVVNGRRYVKEETREKVLAAIEKYNYVPNDVARSLKTSVTKTIGVIVPEIRETFFTQLIKGIDDVIAKSGYSIIIGDTGESPQREDEYLDLFSRRRVDALVLATVSSEPNKILSLIVNEIPVVFVDNLPRLSISFDAVLIDNELASQMAVDYLTGLSHRNIAIILGSKAETTGYNRLLGFSSRMSELGIATDTALIKYGDYKEASGFACMEELLASRDVHPFSAVYVTSELMTYGAMKAIINNGLRVPDDISVLGFDVHDRSGLMRPGITTLRQPEEYIGRYTGELLIKRLSDAEEASKQKILLEPYIDIKESCKKLD